ncbi:MAG: hypothetical protein S4CHLAM2_04970 [Chlamydiales bacterium]|nr:hypothetical protein [Chlamydiales bacterium]
MNNKQTFRFDLLDKEGAQTIAKEVLNLMEEGMTLQEATGVSDETLEEIYNLAYGYYDQGKYKEAVSLFHFLAGASPRTYKYVLGLASSFHQIGAFEEAAVGFYCALNIEPENPIPAYYVTDCFLKQNCVEEAAEFAELTIEICDNRPEYRNIQERCDLIKKSLKK